MKCNYVWANNYGTYFRRKKTLRLLHSPFHAHMTRFTEWSPERVPLQMPWSIVCECAGASVATAGVLTRGSCSLCVCRRWVQTSLRSDWGSKTMCGHESAQRNVVSWPREWILWDVVEQDNVERYQSYVRAVNCELWPVWERILWWCWVHACL